MKTDSHIKAAVDFIVGEAMLAVGNEEKLNRLYHELLDKDWFMTLLDFNSYIMTKEEAIKDYEDRKAWAHKMLLTAALS